MPMPAPANMAYTTSSSLQPHSSWAASSTPGRMPQEPPVGVATTLPLRLFQPLTAMAFCTARAVMSLGMTPFSMPCLIL